MDKWIMFAAGMVAGAVMMGMLMREVCIRSQRLGRTRYGRRCAVRRVWQAAARAVRRDYGEGLNDARQGD